MEGGREGEHEDGERGRASYPLQRQPQRATSARSSRRRLGKHNSVLLLLINAPASNCSISTQAVASVPSCASAPNFPPDFASVTDRKNTQLETGSHVNILWCVGRRLGACLEKFEFYHWTRPSACLHTRCATPVRGKESKVSPSRGTVTNPSCLLTTCSP